MYLNMFWGFFWGFSCKICPVNKLAGYPMVFGSSSSEHHILPEPAMGIVLSQSCRPVAAFLQSLHVYLHSTDGSISQGSLWMVTVNHVWVRCAELALCSLHLKPLWPGDNAGEHLGD